MATTEQEILDRLMQSFRKAAEYCDALAVSPKKGLIYRNLRSELQLIEGAARQAGHYRQDMRWMMVGQKAALCHAKAGDWLRSHMPAKYFTALATAMRKLEADTKRLKDAKTGRRGMILPVTRELQRTQGRPVGWTASQGGILVPQAGVAV